MGVRIGGGIGPVRASVGVPPRGCLPFLFTGLVIILVSFWPWLVGTRIALKHGVAKNSAAYNLAGWIPESVWVALVLGVSLLAVKRAAARNAAKAQAIAQQRLAVAQERAGMKFGNTPWFDPELRCVTHSTCSIHHRSTGAAQRCKSKV